MYSVCLSCPLLVMMRMTWHFSGNFICHFHSHSSKACRSCWTDSASASHLMSLYSRQSSAKRRGSEFLTASGRSLIKARNSGGPKTVPWGMSETVIFLQFCLYASWDSLDPEFMHPKLKLCIQPGTRCEIFCCVLDFSFKLV